MNSNRQPSLPSEPGSFPSYQADSSCVYHQPGLSSTYLQPRLTTAYQSLRAYTYHEPSVQSVTLPNHTAYPSSTVRTSHQPSHLTSNQLNQFSTPHMAAQNSSHFPFPRPISDQIIVYSPATRTSYLYKRGPPAVTDTRPSTSSMTLPTTFPDSTPSTSYMTLPDTVADESPTTGYMTLPDTDPDKIPPGTCMTVPVQVPGSTPGSYITLPATVSYQRPSCMPLPATVPDTTLSSSSRPLLSTVPGNKPSTSSLILPPTVPNNEPSTSSLILPTTVPDNKPSTSSLIQPTTVPNSRPSTSSTTLPGTDDGRTPSMKKAAMKLYQSASPSAPTETDWLQRKLNCVADELLRFAQTIKNLRKWIVSNKVSKILKATTFLFYVMKLQTSSLKNKGSLLHSSWMQKRGNRISEALQSIVDDPTLHDVSIDESSFQILRKLMENTNLYLEEGPHRDPRLVGVELNSEEEPTAKDEQMDTSEQNANLGTESNPDENSVSTQRNLKRSRNQLSKKTKNKRTKKKKY